MRGRKNSGGEKAVLPRNKTAFQLWPHRILGETLSQPGVFQMQVKASHKSVTKVKIEHQVTTEQC